MPLGLRVTEGLAALEGEGEAEGDSLPRLLLPDGEGEGVPLPLPLGLPLVAAEAEAEGDGEMEGLAAEVPPRKPWTTVVAPARCRAMAIASTAAARHTLVHPTIRGRRRGRPVGGGLGTCHPTVAAHL